ncbi:MAG TPA: SPOR domain-containing protein [Devosia sp.]
MSESQEKSDDLIAELAKLMASNAQGGEPEAKPALKMQPLNEATVASAAPLRIPGMPSPAPAAAPAAAAPAPEAPKPAAAPTIRIPGMSQPVAAAAEPAIVPPAPSAAPAPQAESKPGGQFDFGRPPGVAPVIAPEPMTNWQSREVPKPAPQPAPMASEPVLSVPLKSAPAAPAPAVEPRPIPAAPVAEAKPAPSFKPVPMNRVEPSVAPAPLAAAPAPVVSAPSMPANAPAGDGFDFDFGFGNEPPASASGDSDKPVHDPIADLIAAELDAAEGEDEAPAPAPAPVAAPRPAPIQPAPMQAAPVQPAPVRSFANPNQAPVLVAKPTGSRPAPMPAPRPAPQAQPQRVEADRFAVAPVFGLPGRSAASAAAPAPAPRAEPDPMDEIESLIGEAVRVELSPPEKAPTVTLAPPPPATPVVPPLNTAFAPRRTELKDREPPMRSAEDAILAAAAATGARVDHVDHLDAEDRRPVKRMKVKPPKSRGVSSGARQYIGMAVAGTLLLAAGLGLYWVLGMGRADPSTAPVLTAEVGSAKQPAPVVASAESAAPAATGLFNQIEGRTTPEPNETLVSRDETEGAAPTEVARVVGTEPEDTEGGLANRKVRTVTVRPDGTIVPGDEAVAGNEVLPVARPTVPEIPGAEAQPSELLASVETSEVQPDAIAAAIAGETPVTAEVDPNAVTALVATTQEPSAAASLPATIDPTRVAPAPMPRPSDRTTMVGGANRPVDLTAAIEETPATPVAAAPAPSASSGGQSGPYVQIAAQRSEAEAQASLRNAQSRFGSLWGGAQPYIQRADLGQKGIYYRVRVPTSSLQEASSICSSIKANGGDCMASGG